MLRRFCVLLVLSVCGCVSGKSVLVVSADTYVCLPPTFTVIKTEYRVCGDEVPVDMLTQVKPATSVAQMVMSLKP